jgi:tripartite-type tricarboxylate transporter receptor subunit TctC
MTFRCIAYALAASLLAAPGATLAQSAWPSKTVRIVVPVTTGGPSDLVARILADKLAPALGAAAVAKSDPDGYTPLRATANMAITPFLLSDLLRNSAVSSSRR